MFIILGCCQKKSTSYCCYATFIFGVIFLILGLVILVGGQSILNNAILKTMALHKDTERSVTLKNNHDPIVKYVSEERVFHDHIIF